MYVCLIGLNACLGLGIWSWFQGMKIWMAKTWLEAKKVFLFMKKLGHEITWKDWKGYGLQVEIRVSSLDQKSIVGQALIFLLL